MKDNLVNKSRDLVKDLVNDCISRQAAIDVTWEEPTYTDALNVLTEVRDKIRALPSAQPGWIPTSEKLPERYDNYLITTDDEDVDIGTFHPEFKHWSICDADGFGLMDGVLAWCELPTPWEGKQDETD